MVFHDQRARLIARVTILLSFVVRLDECVEEVDADWSMETTTLLNNLRSDYSDAVSPAFHARDCVFSNKGYDYRGIRHQALGEVPCSSWSIGKDVGDLRANPGLLHRQSLIDGPVGAQGYCRVPLNRGLGLSCFPFWPSRAAACSHEPPPFCDGVGSAQCRFTGNGQEYQGQLSRSQTGRQCMPWRQAYEHVKQLIGSQIKHLPFSDTMNGLHRHFPELREHMYEKYVSPSVWWSKVSHNHCRNWYPWSKNGRDNGPYCFVKSDNVKSGEEPIITVESCDVPFCDDRPTECTYITRGSNGRFDFYIPLPFESSTDDNVVRLSIRSWTIEYPVHARFKFVDTTSLVQRGYFFYVGPLDNVASRIHPMTQMGKFIKWRQYSPNKTMAVEWRNIYFRFDGRARSVEFGDVLDTGVLEPVLQFGDIQFVSPSYMSFAASWEATPACPHTVLRMMYKMNDYFETFWTNVWDFSYDWATGDREVMAFETPSEVPKNAVKHPLNTPLAIWYFSLQHPYKDCQFNYVRSRLMVHVPHMCDSCREITLDGHAFVLHKIERRAGSPDAAPEYEITFTLRSLLIHYGSPRLMLLHQAGTFPQWTREAARLPYDDELKWDFEARWSKHNNPDTPPGLRYYENVDMFGNVDFHLADSNYLIDFEVDVSGEPELVLWHLNDDLTTNSREDGYTSSKFMMRNTTYFQINQEMVGAENQTNTPLMRKRLKRAFVPNLLENKPYKIRVDLKGFKLVFLDTANNKEIELLRYAYPPIEEVNDIKVQHRKKKLPYPYQKNVDRVSRYFGITYAPTFNKGRQAFYTVHCIPRSRLHIPQYPDCVLTHDDPKFAGQWSLTKHGLRCARWDDPLVQDYSSQNVKNLLDEKLLQSDKFDKKYLDIKKNGFKAYKEMQDECREIFRDEGVIGYHFNSMDGILELQTLAKNKDNYPDGSISSAGNNCRNLGSSSQTGPFCFAYTVLMGTKYPFLWPVPDPCEVPRCHFSRCRGTLAGHEYRGSTDVDALGRSCVSWTRERVDKNYGSANTPGAADRLGALLDEVGDTSRCANFVIEPSGADVGAIECLTGDKRRPRAPCHVPICQMGGCTVLVAFDSTADRQNYLRVLGSDPKMLSFGLRHMSLSVEQDGQLALEFTDVPSNSASRESLIVDIGFRVEIRYKAKEDRHHTVLAYKTFPNLIRVLGLQYIWIGIDKDEIRFGKDKDFRNPLLSATVERKPKDSSDVFHFISLMSEDVMAVDWGCKQRCPVWYLTSPSRLYEHWISPQTTEPDRWHFRLRVSVRWTDDFAPSEGSCAGRRRRKGGVHLVFTESAFGLTAASEMHIDIMQGSAGTMTLVHLKSGAQGHPRQLKNPGQFRGPNNDCGECWTSYDINYDASKRHGTVSWQLVSAADGREIARVDIRDYANRKSAFLPTAYHAAAARDCQVPANVVFNCTPPEAFAVERVDGGWEEWSPWECSAPCDGGFGTRDRHCRAPPPNFWGDFCDGDAFEIGVCNDFKCGEFNPDMKDRLREQLRSSDAVTLVRYTGGGVRLLCSNTVGNMARDAMPGLETQWYFNRTTVDFSRWLDMSGGDIYLNKLTTADTGVYICNLRTPAPVRDEATAQVTALVVRSTEPTLRVREGERLEFSCHIDMVGLVYSDLSQRWLHDGRVHQDFGITSPDATNLFSEPAEKKLAGVWECQVTAEALNLSWTTAWQRVVVRPRRTWLTDFRDSIFYRKLSEQHGMRLWLTLAAVVGCLALFCGGYAWLARRTMRREAAEVAQYLRRGDMDEDAVHAAGLSLADIVPDSGEEAWEYGEEGEEEPLLAATGNPFGSDTSAWDSGDTDSLPPPPPL